MAISDPSNTLGKNLKQIGRLALILHGVGFILVIIGLYVLFVYSFAATSAYSYQPFYNFSSAMVGVVALMIITATFLLLTGIFVIRTGMKVGKGIVNNSSMFLPILMFSIFLIILGIIGILLSNASYGYSGDITNTAILSLVSGILLIAGSIIYMRGSQTSKLTGAIVGIVAIALLLAGGSQVQNSVYNLRSVYFTEITGGLLANVGFIIAGVAAMMYPFLKNTKFVQISYLVAITGFILYGISVVTQTLGILSSSIWSLPGISLALMSVVLVGIIMLAVSGFLILGASGIGIAFYLRRLVTSQSDQVIHEEKIESVEGRFCQKCGVKIEGEAEYCKKCGTKLT